MSVAGRDARRELRGIAVPAAALARPGNAAGPAGSPAEQPLRREGRPFGHDGDGHVAFRHVVAAQPEPAALSGPAPSESWTSA